MKFSRLARRIHLYAALFLSPWLLMYTLSTLAMNHRSFFQEKHGHGPVPFKFEREAAYAGSLPPNATPRDIARMILISLDLDGAHTASRRPDGAIVITRNDLTAPRRIVFTPSDHRVVIEKAEPHANAFLERFHRRRGYDTGYALDTLWAVTVDLFIVAMIIWVLSGVWMWWELKITRRLGAVALAGGATLFAVYLFNI